MFECEYGHFTENGREYVVTRPDTPRPWVNIISNGEYGLIVSQSGTGFSWLSNSNLNRITRFSQDMVQDDMGRFLYIRDDETGEYWSAGWKPVCAKPDRYECRHGVGYSVITNETRGIESELTLFACPEEPAEIWILKLRNKGDTARNLSLFSYLEWNLGVYNVENREFQKIFIDVEYNVALGSFLATKRLWEVPNGRGENLNADWNWVAFHAASRQPESWDGDRESFIGMYGSRAKPRALGIDRLEGNAGKWVDGIASLHFRQALQPGGEAEIVFATGAAGDRNDAARLITKYKDIGEAYKALNAVGALWEPHLAGCTAETPDPALDIFVNTWLKYQAISCRLWSRTAYYQSGGAYGFRDQLQDSQLFLSYMPELTKKQILLHARHQHNDGTVLHWWQPLTEEGPHSRFSDDLLWLPFVINNYLKETADFSLLDISEPFLDGGEASLYEHCRRSIDRALHRFSPRGIPLIGEADWNDGLSACGTDWVGESFWMGEFLYQILNEFVPAMNYAGDHAFQKRCGEAAICLKENVNRHGWDGEWYLQCTTDSGKALGSKDCREGKIFLNPQTWAILSGILPEERRTSSVINSIKKYLLKDYGPLLLWPAYTVPDSGIGYLTRYAPGLRENGGVYSHAATWAIQAFCKLGMAEEAYDIFRRICTVNRSSDIETYLCEPYVMPGNTDGPDSPHYGRGGWTWYTGSAAWLFRVVHEHILGVRPEANGLLVDPCIPSVWDGYKVMRNFRGAVYRIEVVNPEHVSRGVLSLTLNGQPVEGSLLPPCPAGSVNTVRAVMGT